MNNFDLIAPFYDRLAGLVFKGAIYEASHHLVGEIAKEDHVLVLGGGTGKILDKLPFCKKVDFLDKSSKMIEIAKKRKSSNPVYFVHEDFLSYSCEGQYSIVICPFFLDCFGHEKLGYILKKIKRILKPGGKLMVTDFQSTRKSLLMVTMHLFFRFFASLESKSLKNIHESVLQSGFKMEKEVFFYKNLIFSRIYRNL